MGQHSKYSFEMKLDAVTKYLEGSCSTESIARSLGTNGTRIVEWVTLYQSLGIEGLKTTPKLRVYSAETKQNAVADYLSGKGTLREIQKKYGIRSDKQLRNWIMKYNGHEKLKASGTGGTSIMTKGRKTSYEERVEIVTYCIEHGMDYAQAAEKYQVSYQQIYQWTKKYQSNGVEGLIDKRGKRKSETERSELENLRAENKLLQAEKRRAQLEVAFLKKTRRNRKEAVLSQTQNETVYLAIQEIYDEQGCSISELCRFAGISRSAYYKWLNRKPSENEKFNQKLCVLIRDAYEEKSGILGYRQMTIKLNRENEFQVNAKRILRLMRILHLKSVCRRRRRNHVKSTPEVTAENILNREFHAQRFGEKWLTDVTEMKYGASGKAYLSAILDLADKSIVSFVIGHSNNNALVFETFDIAHENHPDAKPLFHSDRGYQYTSKSFRKKLNKAGMTQSMSRVSRCIDNGPMEAFWGMLKSEMYCLKKFQTYEELKEAISDYIDYYNNHRYQKRLNCMTPMEYRNYLKDAA